VKAFRLISPGGADEVVLPAIDTASTATPALMLLGGLQLGQGTAWS
jgi:hypothetical protein